MFTVMKLGKNNEIRFKVTLEELEKIKRKAEAIGLSVGAYVRFLSLSAKTPIKLQ